MLKPIYRWVSWNSKQIDGAFVLMLPITLKYADIRCSHPSRLHRVLPGPPWSRLEQYQCPAQKCWESSTYLTDLFQGGDEEVVTHNGQCVEHVHGLEERRGERIKLSQGKAMGWGSGHPLSSWIQHPTQGKNKDFAKPVRSHVISPFLSDIIPYHCPPCPPHCSPNMPWMPVPQPLHFLLPLLGIHSPRSPWITLSCPSSLWINVNLCKRPWILLPPILSIPLPCFVFLDILSVKFICLLSSPLEVHVKYELYLSHLSPALTSA